MTLSEIVTIAGERVNKTTTISDVKTRFIRHVNTIREFAWDKFDWSFKKKGYPLRTYDQINSGTASVTNGSNSVTLSASLLSSAYVGAYFRVLGSVPETWHKIIAQSGSSFIIDSPYQGAANSVASYEIRKVDYLVPSEISGAIKLTDGIDQEIPVESVMTLPVLLPISRGKPGRAVVWSSDTIGTTYTTGTISGSVNSRTVTGSGTSWLNNIKEGDQLEVSVVGTTYKYNVCSVESDTSLTLYQFLRVAISAGSSYTIRNQFGRVLRFDTNPDDEYTFTLIGDRHIYPLAHDDDTDELLSFHSSALIEGIIGLEQGASPDDRENPQMAKFFSMLGTKAGSDARTSSKFNPTPVLLPWGNYRA